MVPSDGQELSGFKLIQSANNPVVLGRCYKITHTKDNSSLFI
jgi:hypothetical protein